MEEKKRKESSEDPAPKEPKKAAKKSASKKKAAPKKSAKKRGGQRRKSKGKHLPPNFLDDLPQTPELTDAQLATFAKFFGQINPQVVKNQSDISKMSNMMREYMPSFLLIGYTFDGRPVTVQCANTQQESDSLNTALQRYIFDQLNGRDG